MGIDPSATPGEDGRNIMSGSKRSNDRKKRARQQRKRASREEEEGEEDQKMESSSTKQHQSADNRDRSRGEEEETADNLQFEDDYEDEEEVEVIVGSGDEEEEAANGSERKTEGPRVWRPGVDQLEEGEELDYDATAYNVFHRMKMEWPCLSFDIIRDNLGHFRRKAPHTVFVAAGTQALETNQNKIVLMKMSQLHRTKHDGMDAEDEDRSDSDIDDLDDDPIVEERSVMHPGAVNRLKCMPQRPAVIASFSESSNVHIWDCSELVAALDKPPTKMLAPCKPVYTFEGHPEEGFALDWSPVTAGRLISGDCRKHIYLWNAAEGGWAVDKVPFHGHTASVEDLAWSPAEANVFASCSVDRTVRIWDARNRKGSALSVEAHTEDVNVISWNPKAQHLLMSGSDDGSFKIWDLRNFKADQPAAHFRYHKGPITSVEWSPHEDSILAVASDDNSISVWDMSLEDDAEEIPRGARIDHADLPSQLLFVHQGQQHIKELHFHPQIPNMIASTAQDGFNVFMPSNMTDPVPPEMAAKN